MRAMAGTALKTARAAPSAVAIVGASCRLPGAPNMESFASLLGNGIDSVTSIPADRWALPLYLGPAAQPGKSYTFAAGCLDEIASFDAAFFGISPREAVQMDPQQRLLLELALEALEDAGIRPSRLAGSQTGVYVGGSSSDYLTLRIGDVSVADAYFMTGVTLCSLANRISHAFDLRGSSFTVDTACSSSLVALHLACSALSQGEVDVALVGGVNMLLTPHSFVGFSRASMLSPWGRCHAFEARADGYVRAEGGGVLVLKPLAAALADGDAIHAVILATAVNSDGRTNGLSLPSEAAQTALLEEAYERAGVSPDDLVYFEAHGTGTPVGDPIEAAAIGAVLGRRRRHKLPIGSVKTNIGHLEAASGIAGMLKLLLVLRERCIPATLHFETPNPAIPFESLNLQVTSTQLQLARTGLPIVGINSFGFGGTNAHAVLQAPPATGVQAEMEPAAPPPMLLLSARSEGALRALGRSWHERLQTAGQEPGMLASHVRGAARHREHYQHRLAILGEDARSLAQGLAAFQAEKASPTVIMGRALREPGRLAFAYGGNGSQWAGMAQDALEHNDAFRTALQLLDDKLAPELNWSVVESLKAPDEAALRHTSVAQPLLLAVQLATVEALRSYGVVADAHLGHSLGEVAAACAAGALTLDDAVRVIFERSRHQQATHGRGRMAVLEIAPEEDSWSALTEWPDVALAAINSRRSITVAGCAATLERLGRHAAEHGRTFIPLDIDYAFHSAAMEPIRAPLLRDLQNIQPRRAVSMLASCVTGGLVDGTGLDAAYWWRNVREPVRFADALDALLAHGVRTIVEISPQVVLQSFLREGLAAAGVTGQVLPSLTRRPLRVDPVLVTAARCHVAGHDISDGPLFAGPALFRDLPHYTWQRDSFWTERTQEATDRIAPVSDHSLLGYRSNDLASGWSNHIDLRSQPWLADHQVDDSVVLPAAAMIDMALAAAHALHPTAAVLELFDFEISQPMVFEAETMLEVALGPATEDGRFRLASRPRLQARSFSVHAEGRLGAAGPTRPMHDAKPRPAAAQTRLEPEVFYALAARHGLQYGPAFRTVTGVDIHAPDQVTVHLRPTGRMPADGGFLIDPTLLDGAFQGLVALVPKIEGRVNVLPVRLGRVRLLQRGRAPVQACLRLTAMGPRSAAAHIVLRDAEGLVVAELQECWFVMLRSDALRHSAAALLHPCLVPLPDGAAPTGMEVLKMPAVAASSGQADQGLLADALLSSAAHAALHNITEAGGPTFDPMRLVAEGAVSTHAADLLHTALAWLEEDGLATRLGQHWRLNLSDLPPPTALFGSLLFDDGASSGEAALVAHMVQNLRQHLTGGTFPVLPDSQVDQVLSASPSARAVLTRLEASVATVLATWPRNRPLRILELDGARSGLTCRMMQILSDRTGYSYHILAESGAEPAATLAESASLRRVCVLHEPAKIARGSYDLVVGAFALTRLPDGAHLAEAALRPGGMLLVAEPGPSRLWQAFRHAGLAQPHSLMNAASWNNVLAGWQMDGVVCTDLAGPLWPCVLLQARRPVPTVHIHTAQKPPVGSILCALEQSGLGVEATPLGRALATAIPGSLFCGLDDLPRLLIAPDENVPPVVLLIPEPAASETAQCALPAAPLTAIASLARLLDGSRPVRLLLAMRAGVQGSPWASAVSALGRVLTNEACELSVCCVRISPELSEIEMADRIARELSVNDGEDDIAWTPEARLGTRFVPLAEPAGVSGLPVRLAISRPGLLGSLAWQAAPTRAPGPGEVQVEVTAAGLNFRDVMWALGQLPDEALIGGFAGPTLGLECAGRVRAVGPDVTTLSPGMRVMGFAPASLSSEVVTSVHALTHIPPELSDVEAATIPIAFLTVAYALGTLGRIQPGERVLIHGAAGAVGLAAIQYARHRGATIFATAGSPTKRALLELLGIEHVLDSRSLSFADDVMALTDGEGVDVVLNTLSGAAMERSLGLVRPFGRFLELSKRDLYKNTQVGLRPFRNNVTYFAIDADKLHTQRPDIAAALLGEVRGLLEAGAVRPLPHRVFGFEAVTDAFRLMQGGGHVGKIVLCPGTQPPLPTRLAEFAANREGLYVLTGAVGGFGAQAALWLADHGARHLAVLSRRGWEDPAAATLLEGCAARGATLQIHTCDVSDSDALASVLAALRESGRPIVGVMHAAMLLDDALLSELNEARFVSVLQPKLGGAEALDRLTRNDPIEIFVLFSSIAALLGNPGQGNYVAANGALQGIAERRRAEGLPGVAIGWAPITDLGILARSPLVGDMLARVTGGAHLTAAEALAALPAMLAGGTAAVFQAPIDWDSARQHLPALAGASFHYLVSEAATGAMQRNLRAILLEMRPEQARAQIALTLARHVAEIMRLPLSRIDLDAPLTELGMDSLMAVELRLTLEENFGFPMPMLQLGEHVTPTSLAARIVRAMDSSDTEEHERFVALAAHHEDVRTIDIPAGDADADEVVIAAAE